MATILAPVYQEVIATGVAYTVRVSAPTATTIDIYDDAALLGAASSVGGGEWEYSWTPSSTDMDVNLRAKEDDSVFSESVLCVTSAINFLQTISSWSKSTGITITGGFSDPDGGSSAYKIECPAGTNTQRQFNRAPTAVPTEINSGFEFWAKPNGMDVLLIYPLGDGSDNYAYIDLVTGETKTRNAIASIVERGPDSWVRVWFQQINSAGNPPGTTYFYLCNDINDNTPDTLAGDGIYFYHPHQIDGVPPFTTYQKLAIRYATVSNGVEDWEYTHPFDASEADVGLNVNHVYVIKPTGWSSSGNYQVVWALPALAVTTEAVHTIMATGGYADAHNCVICIPYIKGTNQAFNYWAAKNDGTFITGELLADALVPFSEEYLGAGAGREYQSLIGYSKSAWGALSVLMLHSDRIGRVSVFDGNWDQTYGTNGTAEQFASAAQMDLFDPSLIAAANAAGLTDKTRVHFEGYAIYNSTTYAGIKSVLDAQSITYTENDFDYGDSGAHVWDGSWLSPAVTAIFDLIGGGATVTISNLATSTIGATSVTLSYDITYP